jgi:hypothetical protein
MIEGRIEVKERRGRRCEELLVKGKERVMEIKEEALDRNVWCTGFGRGCGPVVRQQTDE